MKFATAYFLVLILNILIVYGQASTPWIDNWDKILITDSYGGWSHFENEFQISRENLALCYVNKPDSALKQIRAGLIDSLFLSLHNKKHIKYDPLAMFGRDSTWLIENAELLWYEYLGKSKESPEIDSIALYTLKDYSKIKRTIWGLQGSHWTDDYPFALVQILIGQDTLSISSFGQYPYMLPWDVSGKAIYNSQVSKIISQILPGNVKTNKSRLAGEGFNFHLVDRIYNRHIEDDVKYLRARQKYPKQFKYLESEFEIKHAEMSCMTSIEWGGLWGKSCIEIALCDSNISNQIQFSAVFRRHNIIHSPKSIVRNKERLIDDLLGNPVYEYAKDCKNCLGEVHWVQSKSLSGEAKRCFLRDVKDNGMSKNIFNRKFKDAIFFELTEYRNSKRSFSRWIFFKDGTIVLWQLQGDYLMHLPLELIKNQGYICSIIAKDNF